MGQMVFQLILAVIVGGLIGAERQIRVGVGLRTLMLICLGATMFTIYSDIFSFGEGDPRRIAAAVVTGVGFLGAGMILRYRGGIFGLTTAASVWLVAALGMGIGIEQYALVGIATVLVLVVLWLIPHVQRLTNARQTLTYEIVSPIDEKKFEALSQQFKDDGLTVNQAIISKKEKQMTCIWRVYGSPKKHDRLMLKLLTDAELDEVQVV